MANPRPVGVGVASAPVLVVPATAAKKKPAKKPVKAAKSKGKPKSTAAVFRPSYFSSSPHQPLKKEFAAAVTDLQDWLKMKVWLCVHRSPYKLNPDPGTTVDQLLVAGIKEATRAVPRGQPIAVLVHSGGGQAKSAYQAAMRLRTHCGSFSAVVPAYAKSAATLFCLGASKLYQGEDAELGPLDAQIFDSDREGYRSALDEVQALESLHSYALEALDQTMYLLKQGTGKSLDKLLPLSLDFCSKMMQPLLEKIDTVHFTQMHRLLREAQEYATRLLQPAYSAFDAMKIAAALVEDYPVHEFDIDRAEAAKLGLRTEALTLDQEQVLHRIYENLPRNYSVVGFVKQGVA